MWQFVIQRIPENQLQNWFGWLTLLAVVLPLVGGLFGWAAWKIGDRVSEIKEQGYEQKLAAAQLEAQAAKSLAAETQAQLKPRSISQDQKVVLDAELKQAAKAGLAQVPIIVASRMMDQESLNLGRELTSVISASGWEIRFTELSSHSFSGIVVFYQTKEEVSPACQAVQEAFRRAKIQFTTERLDIKRTPIQVDRAIYVIVGHK